MMCNAPERIWACYDAVKNRAYWAGPDGLYQTDCLVGEYIRADLAAERERKLVEVLGLADDALTEAEAILGGEYGDHYQSLCDTMLTLRTKIASLSEELGYE